MSNKAYFEIIAHYDEDELPGTPEDVDVFLRGLQLRLLESVDEEGSDYIVVRHTENPDGE